MARTSAGGGIQPAEVQNSVHTYAEDAEVSDAYAITLTPAVSAYTAGQMFLFKANTANSGSASLNVNGLGAKTIKKHKSEDLADSDIKKDSVVSVVYDGTNFQMISMLSNAPAGSGDMTKAVYDTNNDGVVNEATAVEGTGVKSTGEAGGTKFLREDGDGTSSWQTPSYSTRDSLGIDTDDTPGFAGVAVSKSAGNNRSIFLKTGSENRIEIGASSGLETGSSAGSDLFVNTYDDDGNYLGTPLYMSRATGNTTFSGSLQSASLELGHASDTTIARVSAGVASIEGKNIALNGMGEALTTGTIEIGHASDTTISRASAGVIAVEGVNVLLSGGALGTPASGTLTNCTGLPLSGVTDSTSEALGVGTLELGHASDTTLARVSAGVASIEGKNIALNGTGETLTTGTIELGAASDTTISRASAGVIAVEGVNVLTTAGGTLTGNITLGENTSVDLDPSLSADGKYSGTCITGTAGAALAFGDIVYYNSSSKWVKADADAAATAGPVLVGLVVLAASGDTEPTKVLLMGNIREDDWNWTVGGAIYISGGTAGTLTQTAPTTTDHVVRVVGWALSADSMMFMPSTSHITHV